MGKYSDLAKQLSSVSEKLSDKNKKIFDDVILYIRSSNIKTIDAEEFLQQMLDSFLNAQDRGEDIETVLGTDDIRNYCDEIINTYKQSYNFSARNADYINYGGIVLVILTIINYIIQMVTHKPIEFTTNFNVTLYVIFQYIITPLVIILLFKNVKKECFSKKKVSDFKEFLKYWAYSCIFIVIMGLCSLVLDNIYLFNVNILIILAAGVVLWFIGNYFSQK